MCQGHLAVDSPKGFGAGEAVAFFEAGDLGFAISGYDNSGVHAFIDAGLEEERDVVDHHGVRIFSSGLSRQSPLFARDARVNHVLQLA